MNNEAANELVRVLKASVKEQKLTNSLLVELLKSPGVKPPVAKPKLPAAVKAVPKPAAKAPGRFW